MSDIAVSDRSVTLTQDEADILARAVDLAIAASDALNMTIRSREHLCELRDRLAPPLGALVRMPMFDRAEDLGSPSRAQELAGDAMAAKYGRCGVRMQADGSAVITGLIDDIERETVCIERDGAERWRR